ncbi:MAG: energy-coupling factor ABC transporter ATP-binding protein, partial [Acidimicrobiales bacterium]
PEAPPRAGEAVARLVGVGHVYAPRSPWAHRALAGVDLDVIAGKGLLVAGPNGSGKSTLAWILAGLVTPTEGRVVPDVGGRSRGRVGMAFQHARLQVVRSTVARDVAWGTSLDDEAVAGALAGVGLDPEEMAARRVDTLSGGQLRRVALAGLLARRPRLVILDEPLAGLDEEGTQLVVTALARLRAEHGIATVVVSHDVDDAGRLADRLVVLSGGRVVADEVVSGDAGEARGAGGAGRAGEAVALPQPEGRR